MSREPFETMPDVMDAKQLAEALQISKAGAYNLLNDPIAEFRTYSVSSEDFPSKNRITFLVQEPGYFYKNQEDL